MSTITVEISENSYSIVKEFLDQVDERGILKGIKRRDKGNKVIYSTSRYDDREFLSKMNELLVNCILNVYEVYLIEKIISDKYTYFDKMERERIAQIAINLIDEENDIVERAIVIRRKLVICEELMKYLEVDKNIIIEGFINFRLKRYLEILEKIVRKAVDVYEKEREYNEFIDLLKYFVEVQKPKIDVIYLTIHKSGKFKICDKFNQDVSHLYLEEMQEDLLNKQLSNEDILLGALITISPKKIILKDSYKGLLESDIIRTISNIFEDRLLVGRW